MNNNVNSVVFTYKLNTHQSLFCKTGRTDKFCSVNTRRNEEELDYLNKINKIQIAFCGLNTGNETQISGIEENSEIVIKIPAKKYKNGQLYFSTVPNTSDESSISFIKSKKNSENMFEFHIPALNRKNNTYFENINIEKLIFDKKEISPNSTLFPKSIQKTIKVPEYFKRSLVQKISLGEVQPFNTQGTNIIPGTAEGQLLHISSEENFAKEVMNYTGDVPRIVYLDDITLLLKKLCPNLVPNENFYLPRNIKGIICGSNNCNRLFIDILSHVAARLRNHQVISIFENSDKNAHDKISNFVNKYNGKNIQINAMAHKLSVTPIQNITIYKNKNFNSKSNIFLIDSSVKKPVAYNEQQPTLEQVGLKAFNLWKLQDIAQKAKIQKSNCSFKVPPFLVLPSGFFRFDSELYPEVEKNIDKIPDEAKHFACNSIRDAIETGKNNIIRNEKQLFKSFFKTFNISDKNSFPKSPQEVYNYEPGATNPSIDCPFQVKKLYRETPVYIARSSFTGEDCSEFPTQGLYDSIAGIRTQDELMTAIKKVYSSKWGDLAYGVRKDYGIKHNQIQPNIILQQLMPVDYTFTAYTKSSANKKNNMVIQLSQGVVSGYYGDPYVFLYNRDNGTSKRVMLAQKGRKKDVNEVFMNDIRDFRHGFTDYSNDVLNKSSLEYSPVIEKISNICKFIEKNFDNIPQDIEGGIKWNSDANDYDVYIWQSRNITSAKK